MMKLFVPLIFLSFFFQLSAEVQGFKMYIVLGYPGSGKGTFAQVLQERGYMHISTGELLRSEVKQKTPLGLKYKKEIESASNLLPQEVVENVVLNKAKHLLKEKKKFILDGFPKTVEQAQYLSQLIEEHGLSQHVRIIYIDAPLNTVLERVQKRETCEGCGKIYNLVSAPPKVLGICDRCGSPLAHRACDNPESFHKRILLFNKTVKKVLDYYQFQGALIKINSNMPLKEFITQVVALDEEL